MYIPTHVQGLALTLQALPPHAHPTVQFLLWPIWTPDMPIRMHWDFLMLVMMVYVVICTPYIIAFGIRTVGQLVNLSLACT